jgi:type IV pilus assembly protein PilV
MLIVSKTRQPARQNGFSLVEVLIALIIMSVGMLGIATLFVQSMQAGRTSMFRHHAVTLAGDVADRIRANPRAGIAYTLAGVDNACVGYGTDCNEAAMAAHDIFLWDQQVAESLPNGDVTIAFDNTVIPPMYTITIDWDEPGEDPMSPLNYIINIPVMGF